MSENEKYQKIFDYFGYEAQRRKLTEETQELNDAILLYENGIGSIEDVIEEMADIVNIIDGFMVDYEIDVNEILPIMGQKLDRTIQRIDSGYYGSRKSN